MKNLLHSGRLLVADLASTLVFLIVMLATHNLILAVSLGIALGIVQISVLVVRKKPIGAMQWLSLILILVSGSATLVTRNPQFVMIKPSVIYAVVGVVMLKPGWMNRYLPPLAVEVVPDIGVIFGYVWAGLMFVSALVNLAVVALDLDIVTWGTVMSIYGIASKLVLFLIQYAVMRYIGERRQRSQVAATAA